MATALFIIQSGHVLGTHSWVDGFRPVVAPRHAMNEDDILAHCMWLVAHVSEEAAEEFLERELKKRPCAH